MRCNPHCVLWLGSERTMQANQHHWFLVVQYCIVINLERRNFYSVDNFAGKGRGMGIKCAGTGAIYHETVQNSSTLYTVHGSRMRTGSKNGCLCETGRPHECRSATQRQWTSLVQVMNFGQCLKWSKKEAVSLPQSEVEFPLRRILFIWKWWVLVHSEWYFMWFRATRE